MIEAPKTRRYRLASPQDGRVGRTMRWVRPESLSLLEPDPPLRVNGWCARLTSGWLLVYRVDQQVVVQVGKDRVPLEPETCVEAVRYLGGVVAGVSLKSPADRRLSIWHLNLWKLGHYDWLDELALDHVSAVQRLAGSHEDVAACLDQWVPRGAQDDRF